MFPYLTSVEQMQDVADYIRSSLTQTGAWKDGEWKIRGWLLKLLQRRLAGCKASLPYTTRALFILLLLRFRWVSCKVHYLLRRLPACALHASEELPESLDATYERILQDIDKANWKFAHRLFQAVTVAIRPHSCRGACRVSRV